MKIKPPNLKRKKSHQDKIADLLVKQHKKNEDLQKKSLDPSIFSIFLLNNSTNKLKDK